MAEELKPCPFCGGDDLNRSSNGVNNHFICCDSCGTEGPARERVDLAKTAWNTRAQLHSLQGAGEAVAWVQSIPVSEHQPCKPQQDCGNGYKIPLYTHPADPDAVPVRREMLEQASEGLQVLDSLIESIQVNGNYSSAATVNFLNQTAGCFYQLRQLLADSEGVKP